jgi:hypothetical protein
VGSVPVLAEGQQAPPIPVAPLGPAPSHGMLPAQLGVSTVLSAEAAGQPSTVVPRVRHTTPPPGGSPDDEAATVRPPPGDLFADELQSLWDWKHRGNPDDPTQGGGA